MGMTDNSLLEKSADSREQTEGGLETAQAYVNRVDERQRFRIVCCARVLHDLLNRARAAHRGGRGQFLSRARHGDRSDRR